MVSGACDAISLGKHTSVVDLARASVHGLEELVHLVVRHLLAEVCQDILELADADEARHVLVKHLEAAAVLFGLAGLTEAAGAVQDALERLKVDCRLLVAILSQEESAMSSRRSVFAPAVSSRWHHNNAPTLRLPASPPSPLHLLTFLAEALLQVVNLGKSRVLAARAQQVAEGIAGAATVAALVKQGKSLLVVGRSLGVELVRRHREGNGKMDEKERCDAEYFWKQNRCRSNKSESSCPGKYTAVGQTLANAHSQSLSSH